MLLLASLAFAAEPTFLPLTSDPIVGDHTARAGLAGTADSTGVVGAQALVEVAIVSRVALQVRAGGELGSEGPLLGGQASVEILDEATAPIGLGAAVRYTHVGFDGVDAETEVEIAASRQLGPVRLLVNATGGKDLAEDEGDVEGAVAGLVALSPLVGIGLDARGRVMLGDAEDESEGDERRGWDSRAGAVVTVGDERVSGFGFAGAELVEDRDAARAGALVSLGVQVAL